LQVFRDRGKRGGGLIHPADFGNAIVWNAGFISDEATRLGFCEIVEEGYVLEHSAALELTKRGEEYLYPVAAPNHGATVYRVGEVLLIRQILRGTPPEYVIDEQRERHVAIDDDAGIARAVRDAVAGLL
jgi:hypothetical protein